MGSFGNLFRRILFKTLSLENYLKVLSKLYFMSFNLGLLKKNRQYAYPHFLDKIIEEGYVCLDIGANMGYFAELISKLIGPKGKLYAVEPIKPILSVLKLNTKNLKNVTIYPYALGTENKTIKLGNNTLKNKGFMASRSNFIVESDSNTDLEFEAEMKIGSELFAGLDQLDFIKCDIEGYEVIVIPELKPILSKFYPTVLIEAHGECRIKMLDFFKGLDYVGYILENEKLIPATENESWDILFVHPSKLEKVAKYVA